MSSLVINCRVDLLFSSSFESLCLYREFILIDLCRGVAVFREVTGGLSLAVCLTLLIAVGEKLFGFSGVSPK